LKEKPQSPVYERIGFFDTESTGFKGDEEFLMTYCIKLMDGEMIARAINPNDIKRRIYDKNLCKELVKDLRRFDRLVVYYGGDRRFDIPFIRTRCAKWGLDFPLYKEIKVTDLYDIVKNKFSLRRRKLVSIANLFGIPAKDHGFNPNIWQDARIGHKPSIDYMLTHNKEDVITTEEVYKKIIVYSPPSNKSI
jgi:uncharacterized protein YprB with RNaseH-like and TPR domain